MILSISVSEAHTLLPGLSATELLRVYELLFLTVKNKPGIKLKGRFLSKLVDSDQNLHPVLSASPQQVAARSPGSSPVIFSEATIKRMALSIPKAPYLHSQKLQFERILVFQTPYFGTISIAGTRLKLNHPYYAKYRDAGTTVNVNQLARMLAGNKIPSIDVGISDGRTFLHLIFHSDHLPSEKRLTAIQFCLKQGASIDLRDSRMNTPLSRAAQIGCPFSFRLLIQHGFNQYCDPDTFTFPIEQLVITMDSRVAIADDELACLREILSCEDSRDILQAQCVSHRLKNPLLLELLHSSSEIRFGHSFFEACIVESQEQLESRVKKDPLLLRTRDNWGRSVASMVVIHGRVDLLTMFMAHAPQLLVAKTADGLSLLHLAVLHRRLDIVQYLVYIEPSLVHSESNLGFLPLHVACMIRCEEATKFLLLKGSSLDGSNQALGPIFLACFSESLSIVKILVAHGADLEPHPELGFSPCAFFDFARNQLICSAHNFFGLIVECDLRAKAVAKGQPRLDFSSLRLTDALADIILRRLACMDCPYPLDLMMHDNLLTSIPPALTCLPTLQQVSLDDNPIASIEECKLLANPMDYAMSVKPYLASRQRKSSLSDLSNQGIAQSSKLPLIRGFRRPAKLLHDLQEAPDSAPFCSDLSKLVIPGFGPILIPSLRVPQTDRLHGILKRAGQTGDIETLAGLLETKQIASADASLSDGRTFLHLLFEQDLIRETRINALNYCLSQLVTADLRTNSLATALHGAGRVGCVESFFLLLRYGFNPLLHDDRCLYPIQSLLTTLRLFQTELTSFERTVMESILQHDSILLILNSFHFDLSSNNMPRVSSLFTTPSQLQSHTFLKACHLGDQDTVHRFLRGDNTIIHCRDPLGLAGPAKAVIGGHLDILRLFSTILPNSLAIKSPDGSTLLHLAILYRQHAISNFLLDEMPSLAYQTCSGSFSPLHVACLVRDDLLALTLLNRGVSVDGNPSVISPLYCACFSMSPQLIELLISFGASTASSSLVRCSPYALLVFMKCESVPCLLRLFRLVDEVDQRMRSVYQFKTHLSLSEMGLTDAEVSIILKRIASMKNPFLSSISLRGNNLTRIPLECCQISTLNRMNLTQNILEDDIEKEYVDKAKRSDYRAIREYLMNKKNGELWQLVYQAAYEGEWFTVQKYQARLISTAQRSHPLGETILHRLLLNPKLSAAERVFFIINSILHGADPNSCTIISRETPLHYAARLGCSESLQALVDSGADPLAQTSAGETFLHILARLDKPFNATPLLEHIFEKNLWSKHLILAGPTRIYLMTPLHIAVENPSSQLHKSLLKFSFCHDCIDASHRTPLQIARQLSSSALFRDLVHAGASTNSISVLSFDFMQSDPRVDDMQQSLFTACIYGRESLFDVIQSVLDADDWTYLYDKNGLSLVIHCVLWGHKNILQSLVQLLPSDMVSFVLQKTQISGSKNVGLSPLHLAAELGHVEILQFLLQYIPESINAVSEPLKLTPLIAACMDRESCSVEAVQTLLKAGARVRDQTIDGNTALHFAVLNCPPALVTLLLAADIESILIQNVHGFSPMDIIDYIFLNERCPETFKAEGRQLRHLQVHQICKIVCGICQSLVSQQARSISFAYATLPDDTIEALLMGLVRFPSLRHLDLRGNVLTRIPTTLLHLTQLQSINLQGNSLTTIPIEQEMIEKSREFPPLLHHLMRCQANPPSSQKHLKIVLCGKEGVGKTSLAQCLINNKSYLSQAEREYLLSTDGVAIHDVSIGDQKISLWDFAGQLIYESIHQFMISPALYLLVFDLRKSVEENLITHWCRFILARNPNCQVILVGTHLDFVSDLNYYQEQAQRLHSQFSQISNIHVVSTVTGTNVSELRRSLGDLTSLSTSLSFRDEVLLEYIKYLVHERLEFPVISFHSLFVMASKLTMFKMHSNPREMLCASLQKLQQIGKLLFLVVEKPLSKGPLFLASSLIILDPRWLSDLLVTVISTKLNVSRGVIKRTTASYLLKQAFPKVNSENLLGLLQSFGFIMPLSPIFVKDSLQPDALASPSMLFPLLLPELSLSDVQVIQQACIPDISFESWNFERLYFFQTMPSPLFSHFLNAINLGGYFGDMIRAWQSAALFSGASSCPSLGIECEQLFYLQCIELLHTPAGGEETVHRGIRVVLHVTKTSKFEGLLCVAAQLFRQLSVILNSIIANIFPNICLSHQKIPCPTCPSISILSPISTASHLFDIEDLIQDLARGKTYALCVRCQAPLSEDPCHDPSSSLDPHEKKGLSDCALLIPDYALTDLPRFGASDISFGTMLGVGGFGQVVHAVLNNSDEKPQECAIKFLERPEAYSEFITECLNLAQASHPNVVALLGYVNQPTPGIMMEYLPGDSLHKRIHDPWGFLEILDNLWMFRGRQLLIRDQQRPSPTHDPERWTFETVFADFLTQLTNMPLPPAASSLSDFLPHLILTARNCWDQSDGNTTLQFEKAIAHARFIHLSHLQSPEMSLPPATILRVAMDLAKALSFLHSLVPPLVHLDVKSMNVMLASREPDPLAPTPFIKLVDFGSARPYNALITSLNPLKEVTINPRWAAPEMLDGSYHLGSDIWGWSLVVWEMYSRETPFKIFRGPMSEEIIADQLRKGNRPIILPNIPPVVANLLKAIWLGSPDQRPTAESVHSQLYDYAAQHLPQLLANRRPMRQRSKKNLFGNRSSVQN